MYQVISENRKFQIELDKDSSSGRIEDKAFEADVRKINEREFHIIKDHKSYNVEIVSADYRNKVFHVKVNNTDYHFNAKDQYDMLLEKLGMDNLNNQKINELKAPMPGLVLDILVEPGQEIKEGEGLVVLEAMKMENVLKSPTDVTVKSIEIETGVSVEKNQLLINFE